MESPVIMGEAGDNDCKDNVLNAEDGVCVNGNSSMDESVDDECKDNSKAQMLSVKDIKLHKNNDKVPENKVPIDCDEPMEVDDEDEDEDEDDLDEDDRVRPTTDDSASGIDCENDQDSVSLKIINKKMTNGSGIVNLVDSVDLDDDPLFVESHDIDRDKEKTNSECTDSDVVLIDNDGGEHKENGEVCSSPDVEEISVSLKDTSGSADIVNLVSPVKKKPKKLVEIPSGPPRRSSRNLNKQRSYIEKEDDPDVEEVTPEDPLADPLRDDKENTSKKPRLSATTSGSTIVVSDTKRLVEIAANSKASNGSGKKEPTLVIIDTNSILSGRGPVPVSHKSSSSSSSMSTSFSMMPVALPAQGVYPPNMRATITPIPMNPTPKPAPPPPVLAPILPSLTDDMYVVEAPSFIVPYVYEKPPIKPLKEFVENVAKEVAEMKKRERERREQEKKDRENEKLDDSDEESESSDDGEDKKPKSDAQSKNETDKSNVKKDGEKNNKKEQKSEKSEVCEVDDGDDDEKSVKSKEPDVSVEKKDSAVTKGSELKTIDLDDIPDKVDSPKPKSNSYFDNALGIFFINIGYGLVQEYVQTDLLKQQKHKQDREGVAPGTRQAINSLIKNLEYSRESNEPYKMKQKKCEFCSFKSESGLAMAHHLETPHMRKYVYKCNFCPLEIRSPHDILFHMEAEHNIRGRLERAPAFHQCPNCPFEDNQKGKLSRHLVTCVKKFKPDRNLEPPHDWEPPAKIPRVPRMKQGLASTAATYQALAAQAKGNYQMFSKLHQQNVPQAFPRGRGRPSLMGKMNPVRTQPSILRNNMMYRPSTSGGSVLLPTSYPFSRTPIYQVMGGQSDRLTGTNSTSSVALVPNLSSATSTVTIQNSSGTKSSSNKVVQQPSISITPLPRQPASSSSSSSATITKTSGDNSKATFVICEICDGYIKDLEQLRNHMQWIHKVKIHPKMIYNRPPLNCQKCQFRFFTDQGLERHLLGSHGLVTSSMQEAANKSKDSGRCPVCGRVYQWKLLNHVARDHNMTLKPAHLSYKCTVCTATFGMYKQFENHVYSAHSVVAKRVMEKKSTNTMASRTSDSLLKPLKINDEITIIPQPAKAKTNSASRSSSGNDRGK